ncbi:hypothetical protein K9L05_03605 [Candidatus Babeliales bacterium]|nr:hypothetical protein [Candidatus Babeliales bacterium]MCF7899703.1 hypothetical protein [Candidatus Babeliales bacterium]
MSIFYNILFLITGLIILWRAGERSVIYIQKLSKIYGLSTFFLGFVLLAVSTGIPELAVVIQSLWSGTPNLSLADIIGSNFLDVSVVLGLPSVIFSAIYITKSDYVKTIFMFGLNIFLMSFIFLSRSLTIFHGIFFILIYLASCWYLWKTQKKRGLISGATQEVHEIIAEQKNRKTKFNVFFNLIISLLMTLIASKICVTFAIKLVEASALTFEIVGATILALGTSLPEITLNIAAVRKKDYSLAIGNALGSVLEQGSLLVGLLALFSRSSINLSNIKYLAPFFYLAFLIIGFGIIFRKKINLLEGILLLLLTGAFFAYSYLPLIFV